MKLYLVILSSLIVFGCSTTGFNTANHNGLMYYFPENCSQFKYSYTAPNELHCVYEGVLTGQTISPASQEQISNYRYQQAQNKKGWADLNRSLAETTESIRRNTPKTTYTNCYDSFSGGVNCNSTTY